MRPLPRIVFKHLGDERRRESGGQRGEAIKNKNLRKPPMGKRAGSDPNQPISGKEPETETGGPPHPLGGQPE